MEQEACSGGCDGGLCVEAAVLTPMGYVRVRDLADCGAGCELWDGGGWSHVHFGAVRHVEGVKVDFSNGMSVTCDAQQCFRVRGADEYGLPLECDMRAIDLMDTDVLVAWNYPVIYHAIDVGTCDMGVPYIHGCWAIGDTWIGAHPAGAVSRRPRDFVPVGRDLSTRLRWLEGVMDTRGVTSSSYSGIAMLLKCSRYDFLRDMQIMLTTLGAASGVAPDGEGMWRLQVLPADVQALRGIGFAPRRLWLGGGLDASVARQQVAVKVAQVTPRGACEVVSIAGDCMVDGIMARQLRAPTGPRCSSV